MYSVLFVLLVYYLNYCAGNREVGITSNFLQKISLMLDFMILMLFLVHMGEREELYDDVAVCSNVFLPLCPLQAAGKFSLIKKMPCHAIGSRYVALVGSLPTF